MPLKPFEPNRPVCGTVPVSGSLHPVAARPRLVAVLSPERSGSTLLSQMLGGHPDVLAPPELHLLRWRTFDELCELYPQALASLRWLVSAVDGEVDEPGLIRRYSGRTTHEIYARLLERLRSGQIVIDKTPAYARDPEVLEALESFHPLYVWLVRHPLGVAASKIDALHKQRRLENRQRWQSRAKYPLYQLRRTWQRLSGSELRQHLDYWAEMQGRIGDFLSSVAPERQCIVHFERLVNDPHGEIRRLADRLRIETLPEMFEPWQHAPSELEWGIGDEKVLQAQGVDASRADAWRDRFDESALPAPIRALVADLEARPERPSQPQAQRPPLARTEPV